MAIDSLIVTAIVNAPLRPIPVRSRPSDFTALATKVSLILSLVEAYLVETVKEAATNDETVTIDEEELIREVKAHLGDVSDEIVGSLNQIAQSMIDNRNAR